MDLLLWLLGIIVIVAIAYALLQWSGWPIDPIIYRVGGILLVGLFLAVLIRYLWPIIATGQLPALR